MTAQRLTEEPIPVEICIDASSRQAAQRSAGAAFRGGASRIEVCSDMSVEGLTPPPSSIAEARRVYGTRSGVLAMIRPRPGDFVYSRSELTTMHRDLDMAAEAGADGVVFGALSGPQHRIAEPAVRKLAQQAKDHGLRISFHRAFDAVADRQSALELLIDCGVDRVLSSGTAWGTEGSALEGLVTLESLIGMAAGRIEIVVGGGVRASNVKTILSRIQRRGGPISVHCYSGVVSNGSTSRVRVRELVSLVSEASRTQPPIERS